MSTAGMYGKPVLLQRSHYCSNQTADAMSWSEISRMDNIRRTIVNNRYEQFSLDDLCYPI